MEHALSVLRAHVDVLVEAAGPSTSRRSRVKKTERLKAANSIKDALSRKSTIAALTAASTLEMVRGPQEDPRAATPPLSWAELAAVLVETLDQTCTEALNSRSTSKTGNINLKLDYILCFRLVLKLAMAHGPSGVLRPIVPAFLYFAPQWLSEPPLRVLMADHIWQCVRDILHHDPNRAMLTPPYIRSWVDICLEQLTGRGPLKHSSHVVSKLATEVLEILARGVDNYDIHTQSTKALPPSKMSGGDYGYAIICERCCVMLVMSESMSSRHARELQAVAFRTLTTALSEHALDVIGSNALKSVINVSLKPMLSCWTNRRHHDSAVALASVLLRLDPTNKNLTDLCRQRLLTDMRDESSSAVVRAGHQVKDHFVDALASCVSFGESLQFAASSDAGQGQITVWLRAAHAIISRRVLKIGTSLLADSADVMDQCTAAADAIATMFRTQKDIRESLYSEVARWSSKVIDSAAIIANRIHTEIKPASPAVVETWYKLYLVVREQLVKVNYSIRSKTAQYGTNGEAIHADVHLLQTASLLCTLDILDMAVLNHTAQNAEIQRGTPYPLSKIASSDETPSAPEIGYLRNLVARCGMQDKDGGHLRLRLIHSLVEICGRPLPARDRVARMLIDASSSVAGLALGECTVRPQTCSQIHKDRSQDFASQQLHSQAVQFFQVYFSQSIGMDRVTVEGSRLVKRLRDQGSVFRDAAGILGFSARYATSRGDLRKASHRSNSSSTFGASAHFSVDISITETVESQMLESLNELAENARFEKEIISKHGHDGGSEAGVEATQMHFSESGFREDSSCGLASRIIIFLGNYLYEGLFCGAISLVENSSNDAEGPREGLVALLQKLISTHAATEVSIVISLSELSREVIRVSSRLCDIVRLNLSKPQTNDQFFQKWLELSQALSDSLTALSQNLCVWLMRTLSDRTKQNIEKVQAYAVGRLVGNDSQQCHSSKRKRSLSDHTQSETVKKRRLSPTLSPEGSMESRVITPKPNNKSTGFDDELYDIHSDGSISDDFGDEFLRIPTRKDDNSLRSAPRGKGTVLRQVRKAIETLCWLVNEFPESKDNVVDACLKGIEADEEAERALCPDGFERPALASPLVDDRYMELREYLWTLLIALKTSRALEALAKSVLKTGLHWRDLERVSHSYDSFYIESLRITNNNRKHYPMLKALERMRISFLNYAQQFLELCLSRNEFDDSMQGVVAQLPNAQTTLFLINGIIDISEHSRLRHAFRMPRITRLAYLDFGLTAVKLANEHIADANSSPDSDSLQPLPFREAVQAIQSALCKLLADSEAMVRLAAALAAPVLLSTFSNRPIGQVETLLQDSIPQVSSCCESKIYYGHALEVRPDENVDQDSVGLIFEMSEEERIASLSINESFRKVGAQAKASTSFVAFGEVANIREDLIPFCVVQILFRVMKGAGSLVGAYHIFAKLCTSRGCRSPGHLYKSLSRLILPKWFKNSQDMTLLYQIPSSLFVDRDHHADTILYDWMRDEQSNLLPHFLVKDEAPTFPQTTEFANMLGLDLETLLLTNVGSLSLVFPMQFTRNLHEKGCLLWEAIGALLGDQYQELMFKHKSEVIKSFLRSVSSGTHHYCRWNERTLKSEGLGFFRDTTDVEPPLYDPLVVACAINQLFDSEPNVFVVPKSALRGPLFAEMRDEQTGFVVAEEFRGFIVECQRGKISLLRILLTVSRLLTGPPVPQPSQNHLDAFFCVGMLWRMLGVNILVKSSLERVMFYRLIAKGFEKRETMHDAAWLLLEVQSKAISMDQAFPDVDTDFSDLNVNPSKREHLLCMSSRQERQMYELLNAVSPVLVSITSSTKSQSYEVLKQNASESLRKLLQLCHQKALWTVILCNGPLPDLKNLSQSRNLYESSRSMVEVDPPDDGAAKLLSTLERFQGIYHSRNGLYSTTTMLACLQEVSASLTDSAVASLSHRIFQEAWLRSDGQEQPTIPHVRRSISCLINLIFESNTRLGNASRIASKPSGNFSRESEKEIYLLVRLIHEVGYVMSILGLIHPPSVIYFGNSSQNTLIPSLSERGKYEDVESGIERCLFSLVDILRGPSAISADIALSTLLELLRTEDGKKVFAREKDKLSIINPIRSAARKLGSDELLRRVVNAKDCYTGDVLKTGSFPKLHEPRLWSMERDEQFGLPHEWWMKRLCFVLCSNCTSGAFRTVSSVCLMSYELSCELFPYLMMSIVTHLDSKSLYELSQLILHHILLNTSTPVPVLRIFVHALDVLCQAGSDVVYQEGVSRWLQTVDGLQVPRFRYVLDIPYKQAAEAALKSGSYFSVIRFAQMHVDQAVSFGDLSSSGREQRTEKRHSFSLQRDFSHEVSECVAKQDVTDLVKEAMICINELDGVRAFGCAESLTESVSDLASLDREWAKSLGVLDILGRSDVPGCDRGHEISIITGDSTSQRNTCSINIRRESSLIRSLIGLGALSVAANYWDRLQKKMGRFDVSNRNDIIVSGSSAREEFIDLRYAIAWKLGQWESPPMLPDTNILSTGRRRAIGFHESVFRVLRAFQMERWTEVSNVLAQARRAELHNLVCDSGGASAVRIFQTSARLRIFQLLEDIQRQKSPLVALQKDILSHFPSRAFNASFLEDGSVPMQAGVHRKNPITDVETPKLPHRLNLDTMGKILQGYLRLEDNRGYSQVSLYVDAFNDSILTEELPIALVHSLSRRADIARAAADVSLKIFMGGGNGSWTRSASCLGTAYSALVDDTCESGKVAWKLQESRLRWFASHDASSKKQALSSVKDIISKSLGGCAAEKRSNSYPDFSSFQQTVVWDNDRGNSYRYAYLRSEACIMASNWSLDMRTHEPICLFDTFLEAGLRAVELVKAKNLTGRAHFAMATFADAQIANIDSYRKTRKYVQMVSSIRESENQIEKLQSIQNDRKITSKGSGRRTSRSRLSQLGSGGITEKIGKDLDSFIREEQKKTLQDRTRLEQMDKAYQKWQVLACKHFAGCLREAHSHDLRAAFRMVAIWLDSGQVRESITELLTLKDGEGQDGKNLKLSVPCVKLLSLAPQLSSRLSLSNNLGNSLFQKALSNTIRQMAEEYPAYCLWQLIALSNSTRIGGTQEKYSSLYRGDKDKKDAADAILSSLEVKLSDIVREMRDVADAYIHLSETSNKEKNTVALDLKGKELLRLGELVHVPVPTMPLPLNAALDGSKLPHIVSFERRAGVCSGLSRPLRIICCGSDGKKYPQMVKGRDDLRGDAVMEQLFTILNSLLEKDAEASRRNLLVRTYRIIPLSPFSGIMQFVSNTMQLKDVLVEKGKPTAMKGSRKSLHERYRPNDLKHGEVSSKAFAFKKSHELPQRLKVLRKVWHRIQPVFHFFFLEQWPDPTEWFSHQQAYSRSVAVMSIVGFILGLGDRHLSNILLDVVTGEVVHIDFGIAFEQGKLLPTPEQMPFRLTRDIIDGFGIAGVEGVFRRCSEVTLSVMRCNKDVLLTVVEVLLHDPMFNWDLAPEVVIREQLSLGSKERDTFESDDVSKSLEDSAADAVVREVNKDIKGSSDAQRALNRISEKLDGLEGTERLSVEAHVARLIDEAQAFHVIASVYPGWAPWI